MAIPRPDQIDLSRLSPGEQALLLELLRRQYDGEPFHDFICRVAPTEPPPAHLRIVVDAIQRCKVLGGQRICLSMPPRHGKSTTIRRALSWWLSECPADWCAYTSRTCDGAEAQSRKIRTLSKQIGTRLTKGEDRGDRWGTIHGGGLIACGIDGMLTGNPITGLGIVDDPIKSRAEANSEAYRERVWDFFNDVLMSRLEGPASVIVIHTRWDPDDLIGRLMAEGGWDVINLPAIAYEALDQLGRKPGDPLWPERFPVSHFERIRRVNEFTFESLYQGKPTPKGARLFYGPPCYYDPKDPAFIASGGLKGCTVLIGADPAASAKTTADHSAAVAMAIRPPWDRPTIYILDVYRRQVEVPQQARDLLAFQRRNYGAKMWVEAVAGFKAVPQLLKELAKGILVGEVTPRGDKKQRAETFASAWNDGRVLLPKSDPRSPLTDVPMWVPPYIDELQRFTGKEGGVDDQVDASANAFNQIQEFTGRSQRGSVEDSSAYG
jgi:predicted phage terminase large subunit-like protein